MTVKELIDKLSSFPPDLKVTYYVEGRRADGSARTTCVYEQVDIVKSGLGRVVLEGI